MSIGNLKDSGGKGTNYPWQLAMLKVLNAIAANTAAGGGIDYEMRITPYKANTTVGGCYSLGDFISRTDIINAGLGTIVSTLWFNETTGVALTGGCIPPIGNLDPFIPPSAVTVSNLPMTLGQLLMAQSLSVTIASDQSAIPVTTVVTSRTPSMVSATVNGSTIAGVKSVSMWFRGASGSVGGVSIPNGGVISFSAPENDTLSAIAFVVPTTGESRIIISYVS